jgi:allantoate deiminase
LNIARSKGDISHNPAEWSSQEDCTAGCNTLYCTVLGLGEDLAQEEG